MKRKDGHQSKPIGDQGKEPKRTGIILPRTLLAGAEKCFQEFWIPRKTGIFLDKQEPDVRIQATGPKTM